MINKMLGYREEQKKLFKEDPNKLLGNFTTVNLTHMSGGVQMNVVPNELCIGFDMRVSPTINIVEFQQMLENWMQEVKEHCKDQEFWIFFFIEYKCWVNNFLKRLN